MSEMFEKDPKLEAALAAMDEALEAEARRSTNGYGLRLAAIGALHAHGFWIDEMPPTIKVDRIP